MKNPRRSLLIILLAAIMLAGCASAAGSLQIASYPLQRPIAVYPPAPELVYRAHIELLVSRLEPSAERAARLTQRYQGFIYGRSAWAESGRPAISLDIAVPNENFDALYEDLLELGQTMKISCSTEPLRLDKPRDPNQFALISLHLIAAQANLPIIQPPGWNPLYTLEEALGVSLSILGVLVDILIWVVVVGGPFILIGGLIWWLMRRKNPPDQPEQPEE